MTYNVREFGAVGDGVTLDTAAIQGAVDACAAAGGGRVTLPAGRYLSGSVFLKSHVELHLEMGAVLRGSTDLDDYNAEDAYEQNYGAPKSEFWCGKHLLIAVECTDVALTGLGRIDAAGDAFLEEPRFYPYYEWMTGYSFRDGIAWSKDKTLLRPGQTVCFVECKDVTVTDVTVENSACWSIFFHGCENVRVRGVKVFNPPYFGNSDGIDIDCCRFVTVSDCLIDTGDDAIAIRCAATRLKKPQACEFINISNCALASRSSLIRIGVGVGQIRHVRVSGITARTAGRVINFVTSYSGHGHAEIEDVNFSDISATDVSFPITLEGDRASIRRITLENMRFYSRAGIKLCAKETCEICDVTLRHVEMHLIADTLPMDARRRAARGEYVVSLNGGKRVMLEDVRVIDESGLLTDWSGVYRAENCEACKIRDCSF